jgi:hypothetical protein
MLTAAAVLQLSTNGEKILIKMEQNHVMQAIF